MVVHCLPAVIMVVYWISAVILLVANAACVVGNMLMLPGNWLMVGSLCLFLLGAGADTGPDWTTLLVVIGLAIVGEVLETVTGAAQAMKKGASRRAMILSLILSMVGCMIGAFLIPIPIVGSVIGAVAGAAAGAFGGAWLGEAWNGTDRARRSEIGKAAMNGRMVGMLAKMAIGAAIFVVQLVSLW